MYLVAVAVAAICPAALAASCKPVVIGQKLQRITAVCGPGQPAVPSHCSLQCAQLFTELYGACGDAMDSIGGGMGLDGAFADFNQKCEAAMTTEAVAEACSDDGDWHPTGTSTGVCQNLLETAPASQGGAGAGACGQYIAAGNTCETAFCADCDYAGYCDLECGICEEAGCEHFAEDGLHGCECDRVSGTKHCKCSCNAFCHADAVPGGVQKLTVSRERGDTAVASGSIAAACGEHTGRSAWFEFAATAGRVYKINTLLSEGGLGSASLFVHRIDEAQTELAASRAWHCDANANGPGQIRATCMLWTCVESGSYAVRVAQTSGAGAFQLQVGDFGTLEFTSAAAGLTVLGSAPEPWAGQFDVSCTYTYCNFDKHAAAADAAPARLLADGNAFVMVLSGLEEGGVYTFGAELVDAQEALFVRLEIFSDYPWPGLIVGDVARLQARQLGRQGRGRRVLRGDQPELRHGDLRALPRAAGAKQRQLAMGGAAQGHVLRRGLHQLRRADPGRRQREPRRGDRPAEGRRVRLQEHLQPDGDERGALSAAKGDCSWRQGGCHLLLHWRTRPFPAQTTYMCAELRVRIGKRHCLFFKSNISARSTVLHQAELRYTDPL